jgi:hypothetical protein
MLSTQRISILTQCPKAYLTAASVLRLFSEFVDGNVITFPALGVLASQY